MRQITLTFLGKTRTGEAEHAHESKWTMTVPLIILAIFSICVGWVGIAEEFPVIGGLVPNWFHEFVGGTLHEHPEAIPLNIVPLLASLVVSLGGLTLGWLVYRNLPAGAEDPLKKPLGAFYSVLRNKYYFDEIYNTIFVKPAYWLAETFTYLWLDRRLIDGFLHFVARISSQIGGILRNYFDKPIVNGFGT